MSCKRDSWFPTTVYYNNLNRIIPKPCAQKSYDKYSVVLFVMDSVSHSHWRRSLPKTYKVIHVFAYGNVFQVLSGKYQSIIFHGMTKVGDNSFPNAVAMLSGTFSTFSLWKQNVQDLKAHPNLETSPGFTMTIPSYGQILSSRFVVCDMFACLIWR